MRTSLPIGLTASAFVALLALAACGDKEPVDTGPPEDADGDGFLPGEDCDDTDAAVNPGAIEVCDGVDNDCDLMVDDEDEAVENTTLWYPDEDGDGYGYPYTSQLSCVAPEGWITQKGDCNDSDPNINPGEPEVCDGIDNDCDEKKDGPEAIGVQSFWWDGDGDGYGDPYYEIIYCEMPTGYAALGGDCNDADPAVNPGATEVAANGVDDDCDGSVDEEG